MWRQAGSRIVRRRCDIVGTIRRSRVGMVSVSELHMHSVVTHTSTSIDHGLRKTFSYFPSVCCSLLNSLIR